MDQELSFRSELWQLPTSLEKASVPVGIVAGVVAGGAIAWWPEGLQNSVNYDNAVAGLKSQQPPIARLEHDAKGAGNTAASSFLEAEMAKTNKNLTSLTEHPVNGPGIGEEAGTMDGGTLLVTAILVSMATAVSRHQRTRRAKLSLYRG